MYVAVLGAPRANTKYTRPNLFKNSHNLYLRPELMHDRFLELVIKNQSFEVLGFC